jgi:hypothetical protein
LHEKFKLWLDVHAQRFVHLDGPVINITRRWYLHLAIAVEVRI